jgi:lactate dehydrogenase-like 2-hydroxyacid dehydrogenase
VSGARRAVLLAMRVPDAFRARLERHFDVLGPYGMRLGDAVAALPRADAERVDVVLAYGQSQAPRALLDALPSLGLYCCLGSGYEGVDLEAANARGIAVTHNVGANASAVADLAVGLMIASLRGIASGDAFVRRGEWSPGHRPAEVRGLTGRRVGVWGLGAIGGRIARRCEALEMAVGYHGRAPRDGVAYPYFGTLLELARWADVLMIAVRAVPANRHAVDAAMLAALGADGHVVNVTRGSVIDEAALARALADGTIAGAGLDVFEREPDVPAALRTLPNVVMTPHVGGNATDAQEAMREGALANVEAWVAGRTVLTPVPGSRCA